MGSLVRGIRGAITVERNDAQEIIEATRELLRELVQNNQLEEEAICSVFLR
ncbi:hypothetical protein N752_22295 [Desulforamulus aquiferis]|nr:hypothetical protein N752_22295 [Desulforamulus aquiferis]